MNVWLVFTVTLGLIVLLAVCWLGWQLLRQNGRLLLRLEELEQRLNELEFGKGEEPEGLALGSEAPAFELADLVGERRTLAQFRGQPLMLLFFNPDCGYCREMIPKLAALSPRSRQGNEAEFARPKSEDRLLTSVAPAQVGLPQVVLLTTGEAEKNRQLFAGHKLDYPVLLQEDGEVAKAYQANGTPSGCLISPEGKIASNLAMGAEALLALATEPRSSRGDDAQTSSAQPSTPNSRPDRQSGLTSAATEGNRHVSRFSNRSLAKSKIKRDGLKAGTPAPDFRLPRLDGCGDLRLSELRGRQVLLVFSSPHCGPCEALAPQLEKFHRAHSNLEVVVVSKGEPGENRAKVREHNLTYPIVLQQQWEISRRYAMFATPVAYLIDEAGVIAHDVAVGTDRIQVLMSDAASSVTSHATASFALNSAVKT